MQDRYKSKLGLGLFTGAYLLGAAAYATLTGNTEFVFYIVVMLILIGAVLAVDRRVRFPLAVLWMLSVWGLLHMAGGTVPVPDRLLSAGAKPVLYSLWLIPSLLKYDQVIHFYGFGVATLAAWECLRATLPRGTQPGIGLAVGLALMGMGLGALNEVVEFAATQMLPQTNVGGYENTGWDLVFNMAGAAAAAGYLVLSARTAPPHSSGDGG